MLRVRRQWRASSRRRRRQRSALVWELLGARARVGALKKAALVAKHLPRGERAPAPRARVRRAAVEAAAADAVGELRRRVVRVHDGRARRAGGIRVASVLVAAGWTSGARGRWRRVRVDGGRGQAGGGRVVGGVLVWLLRRPAVRVVSRGRRRVWARGVVVRVAVERRGRGRRARGGRRRVPGVHRRYRRRRRAAGRGRIRLRRGSVV